MCRLAGLLEAGWPCGKHGAWVPSHLQTVKPHVKYRLFYKTCDPSFQWPLIVHSENFFMIGGFIFAVHPPCLSVTLSITLITAEIFDNLRTIILENIKQLVKNPWSYTFMMNAWWFIFGTIFLLYPVLWLTLTLQFPSLVLMSMLIQNYFWSRLYYKQTVCSVIESLQFLYPLFELKKYRLIHLWRKLLFQAHHQFFPAIIWYMTLFAWCH